MKKVIVVLLVIILVFGIVGCERELTVGQDHTGVIGEESEVVVGEQELVSLTTIHTISSFGDPFTFRPLYSVSKKMAENWMFTVPTTINLSAYADNLPDHLEVLVTQLYADISTSSRYQEYNGMRQDSLYITYDALPGGGINVDSDHKYEMPFKVEAVDKSETFFHLYNGWGASSTRRVTEDLLGKDMNGAVLNVVWTLLIKDNTTNKIYMRAIDDNIRIPYNRGEPKK